jgi:predicted TIM-barrel fold metal-dependent hydrolase
MRIAGCFPWPDVDPFVARLLAEAGPRALVWGSDWPFLRAGQRIDYGPLLDVLARWVPDASARAAILVENPRAVFRFA